VSIERGVSLYAEGSALVSFGDTRVLCTASVENGVPPFLRGSGRGWVTAEYALLPRATPSRTPRGPSPRGFEIQRLVGRSLRAVVDLERVGERTVYVDCDVLQADGGTRTAAITGGFVALVDALDCLRRQGLISELPVRDFLAAVSAGVVEGEKVLDLSYEEDSRASVDLNVVGTGKGFLVEVQGGAEGEPFSWDLFGELLSLARQGIGELVTLQRRVLGDLGEEIAAK
jgi:ribonuclease PH